MERYPAEVPADARRNHARIPKRLKDTERYEHPGFNLEYALTRIAGPVVEIGGPTAVGYPMIDNKLPSRPFISNLVEENGRLKRKRDLLLNGCEMPFADNSVGVVLASSIDYIDPNNAWHPSFDVQYYYIKQAQQEYDTYAPSNPPLHRTERLNQRITMIEETARVLEIGGLLVGQFLDHRDIRVARLNGLEVMLWYGDGGKLWPQGDEIPTHNNRCVFMKIA
jgi:hypothetical protein